MYEKVSTAESNIFVKGKGLDTKTSTSIVKLNNCYIRTALFQKCHKKQFTAQREVANKLTQKY